MGFYQEWPPAGNANAPSEAAARPLAMSEGMAYNQPGRECYRGRSAAVGRSALRRKGSKMEEAGVQFRMATLADSDQVRQGIHFTLANPEGRPQRKRYEDSIERRELMVLTRFDNREHVSRIAGFIEWHTRVDGAVTIRDLGTIGDAPQPGTLRVLIRELVHLLGPPLATVKVREDQPLWLEAFRETPGFVPEGREYSRPYWRQIWNWKPEDERLAMRPGRPTAGAGRGQARWR